MPTRKISEREKLTLYARTAGDDELDQAIEILTIEKRIRSGQKPVTASRKKAASKRPVGVPNTTADGAPNNE